MSNNSDKSPKPTEMESEKVRKETEDRDPLPLSIDASSDYSDVVPPGDEQTSQKRRHQRGGRRKKSKGNLQSTSEGRIPWSERNGRLKPEYGSQVDQQDEDEVPDSKNHDEDSELERAARSSLKSRPKGEQTNSDDSSKPFQTGVRAFNLKKAEYSGGRPFGLSVEQPKSKGKSKEEKKTKKKNKKETKKSRSRSSDESEDESEDDEEEPRKPLSIRLDLNLELEIFLRAKVKGDITITFLE